MNGAMESHNERVAVLNEPAAKKQRVDRREPAPTNDGEDRKSEDGAQIENKAPLSDTSNPEMEDLGIADEKPTEIVSKYADLTSFPRKYDAMEPLSEKEKGDLENCLGIGNSQEWPDDWFGKLALAYHEVTSPDIKLKSNNGPKRELVAWLNISKNARKMISYIFRHVFNQPGTPKEAKRIMSHADLTTEQGVVSCLQRVSYDPVVLNQDGWTTQQSDEPIGASGGAFRIGEKIYWQGAEAVVIAYVHDEDLGDLWKAMWLQDLDTFDLEASELDSARRAYERKMKPKSSKSEGNRSMSNSPVPGDGRSRSSRQAASANFSVAGAEFGIIMAVSYAPGAKPGVFWPARIINASEPASFLPNKRTSQKLRIDVVFLAPYWNAVQVRAGGRRDQPASYADAFSKHGTSFFDSGPIFETESVIVGEDSIQSFPYDSTRGLDIDQMRSAFKFTGLPKAAFSRFLNSHRLGLALKTFAQDRLKSTMSDVDKTTALLFESHPMSVHTVLFPQAILHLPFEYIIHQLPHPKRPNKKKYESMDGEIEPAIRLTEVLDAMHPPRCFGQESNADGMVPATPDRSIRRPLIRSPASMPLSFGSKKDGTAVSIEDFSDLLPYLKDVFADESPLSTLLKSMLNGLLDFAPKSASEVDGLDASQRISKGKSFAQAWALTKGQGEDVIKTFCGPSGTAQLAEDWRRICERIYSYFTVGMSTVSYGDGVSVVLSDSCCNQHLTPNGSFERNVRLPAALKALKDIGAGKNADLQLQMSVEKRYMDFVEEKVVIKAHSATYLKRMKSRCAAIVHENEMAPLTQDSDGNGGEDTYGSRGTWTAAIAAVAAAVHAVDMVVQGSCTNVFCATRPPGHHAGRELHSMKAVSNGFCILNAAACAALYATTPLSDQGLGLKRVCVVDIDVHHGNGTQDILCSTYDPRFLYVSLHAGGAHVNGMDLGEDAAEVLGNHLGRKQQGIKGIFPGRCGDTSPHKGVLNLPLGPRVTAHAIGAALLTKALPAVEAFGPDLMILSTGFDAHKNDPLNLGGMEAEDFGSLTEVLCKLAHKLCGGRLVSIMEGGYGVPCCRPPRANHEDVASGQPQQVKPESAPSEDSKPLAGNDKEPSTTENEQQAKTDSQKQPMQVESSAPSIALLDLGDELPPSMPDDVSYALAKRLDKCHQEGFMHCVQEHVKTLVKCNSRK